jgi:hypothetical protein
MLTDDGFVFDIVVHRTDRSAINLISASAERLGGFRIGAVPDRVRRCPEALLPRSPRVAVEWFWSIQVDIELQVGHGYPPDSESHGFNQACLFGVDLQSAIKFPTSGVSGGDAA